MAKTLNKHFRIDEQLWRRLEAAAKDREATPNRLLVDLATQALDGLEWPRTEVEIRMLRSCLFNAQAIAHQMIAAGRKDELEEIRRNFSKIAPEFPVK